MAEPVFGVKLKKTETRIPVVLSQGETQSVDHALRKMTDAFIERAGVLYGDGSKS